MDRTTQKTKKTGTTKKKEIDIHCACAMGDLSEFAPVEPAEKKRKKYRRKFQKRSILKMKLQTKNNN